MKIKLFRRIDLFQTHSTHVRKYQTIQRDYGQSPPYHSNSHSHSVCESIKRLRRNNGRCFFPLPAPSWPRPQPQSRRPTRRPTAPPPSPPVPCPALRPQYGRVVIRLLFKVGDSPWVGFGHSPPQVQKRGVSPGLFGCAEGRKNIF